MFNDIKQIKIGAILSYILIVLNTVYGLFIAPYILKQIGDSQYGVYKTVASFSSSLLVLDLGIGTTVLRYTAKFRAENNEKEVGNFAAMGLLEASVMATILLSLSFVIFFFIDGVYSNAFSVEELFLAKKLYIILILNMILTIFENVLNGVIMGCNRFSFSNGIKLFFLLSRIVAIFVVLMFFRNAEALVLISLIITILSICSQSIYIIFVLKIKIKLIKWNTFLFKESLGYTALMFVQTLAAQANGNIDNMAIGAIIGATAVAVYSFGLQMFNMYESLATSFSNLVLPKVSKQIAAGASDSELQLTVTKVGRFQFMILGAALFGYAVIGREFIQLWLGDGYEDVYFLSLIMMIPATFVLIQNACLSILRAKNMMGFRTLSLIITAALNAFVTIIGTIMFGYYAAAFGTALSITCGSLIMMNIYYFKKIGFKPFKFYFDVSKGLLPAMLIPTLVILVLRFFIYGNWVYFFAKVLIFLIVYIIFLLLFGLNSYEKSIIFRRVSK